MSSHDPEELARRLENIDFPGDSTTLSDFRAEARETVDYQHEMLKDIDTKASHILRLNIALIGILVSVLSITTQRGVNPDSAFGNLDPFVNVYMGIGVGALVLSTVFAAITYSASELDVGVNADNLTKLLRADFTSEEVEELLVKNYIIRMNFN